MSDTEAKPEEGNEPITIRVKDQTGAFCFYIVDYLVDMMSCELGEEKMMFGCTTSHN